MYLEFVVFVECILYIIIQNYSNSQDLVYTNWASQTDKDSCLDHRQPPPLLLSLGQVWEDQVQTLLGSECDDNETLQPAPWASKIAMPLGLWVMETVGSGWGELEEGGEMEIQWGCCKLLVMS